MPVHSIPFELRIGITGHRNLSDPEGVRLAIDSLLDQLDAMFRVAGDDPCGSVESSRSGLKNLVQTLCSLVKKLCRPLTSRPACGTESRTPLEWNVISPLARGADQLAAEAVLSRRASRLTAILPFAVADYEQDFTEEGELDRFRSLWNSASVQQELPGRYEAEQPTDSHHERERKQQLRNAGYLRVGQATVEACDLLIAVWNGRQAAGQGGTGEIVAYAVERNFPVLWIDATNPTAPPQVLVRKTSQDQSDGPLPGTTTQTLSSQAKHLTSTFRQLSAYNRESAHERHGDGAAADHCRKQLSEAASQANLPDHLLEPVLKHVLPYFVEADQRAIRSQQRYLLAAVGLYSLSVAAVTIAVIQVLFFPEQLWLIGFEVLAMLTAVLLLRIGRSESWHEKWLNGRHLAEQLRATLFTGLLDRNRPIAAHNDPRTRLPFYHAPETWVNAALRRIVRDVQTSGPIEPHFPAIKRFVIDGWLRPQAGWHETNAIRKQSAARMSHRAGLVLFLITLIAACLHWQGIGHADGVHDGHAAHFWDQAITAAAIICPAWGAALHAINVLRERERLATRSQQMSRILRETIRNAERAETLEEFHRELDVTCQMMATENLEWWISLSFRELVLPA